MSPEQIADSLTEAAQRVVCGDTAVGLIVGSELDKAGLIEWRDTDWPYRFSLNSLGREVRRILEQRREIVK